jgi:hypothetical protein
VSDPQAPARSHADRVRRERGNCGFGTPGAPRRGYADRVRRERGNNVFFVRGNDATGVAAWYFVLVEPAKRVAFRKALAGQVQLTAYGRIIASGYGADPPADVRERMRTEYGFAGE